MLDGGINRWVTDGLETEWGMNVPSKDFGEKVEVVHHVPEVECKDLAARIQKGEKFVILDSRTPEEFRRFCIPGGRSVPGGELALRITDIAKDVDRDTTIIVNCAGRTRSIISARVLQRMGIPKVFGLKNGTAGWVLAGHKLETGADRVQLPEPSAAGVAAAEAYAVKLAAEDGVRYLGHSGLEERDGAARPGDDLLHRRAHLRGVRRRPHPGLPVVSRRPGRAALRRRCGREELPGRLRVRQEGARDVDRLVVSADGIPRGLRRRRRHGGVGGERRLARDGDTPEEVPAGYQEAAREGEGRVAARSAGVPAGGRHLRRYEPGLRARPRARRPLGASGLDGALDRRRRAVERRRRSWSPAPTAAAPRSPPSTLGELGYQNVSILDGGMAAWQKAGLPLEKGLAGVMTPPTDVVPAGPDRNFADMQNYLRWEEALGQKYAPGRPA